jgi:hypothetical protein
MVSIHCCSFFSLEGKINGFGTFFRIDGTKRTGTWVGEQLHGHAVDEMSNGERYEGEFDRGERHGKGTYVWANSNKYQGQFQRNKIHGLGVLTLANGDVIESKFINERRHGLGRIVRPYVPVDYVYCLDDRAMFSTNVVEVTVMLIVVLVSLFAFS